VVDGVTNGEEGWPQVTHCRCLLQCITCEYPFCSYMCAAKGHLVLCCEWVTAVWFNRLCGQRQVNLMQCSGRGGGVC
jgi:hypothetical protein